MKRLLFAALAGIFVACSTSDATAPRASAPEVDASVAAPGDAAAAEDAGVDAAPDADVDPCVGRAVCDSFESAAVGAAPPAPWHAETATGGTVTVSTARAFRGSRSVKVTTQAASYQSALFTVAGAPLFPVPAGILYGRMMVWLETPAADGVHWTMLAATGPVPGHSGVTGYYRYGGQVAGKLMANYETSGASTDCWQHSATVMPIGRWACVAFRFASADNDMQMSLDGTNLVDLHVSGAGQGCIGHDLGDTWIAPTFAKMALGWESYQNDVGHTMYVDDVILDGAPIACP